MQFQCPHCQSILSSDGVTEGMQVKCPECSRDFVCYPYQRRVSLNAVPSASPSADIPTAIHEKFASAIGIEKLKGFRFGDLFSEVFSKHSREEVEESFTVGTPSTTPDILSVDASWPKPWLFMRMLLASLVLYALFWAGWSHTENENLIPGWILIGSFAVPVSILVLFLELNVRRNVSLYMVFRLTLLGGILSLLFSLVMFEIFDDGTWGASIAGPVEETGKILAMLAVARAAKYRYKLNGLLIGAAVGVGFAVFETAGYALRYLIGSGGRISVMKEVLLTRGIFAPFCHVVWSAIAGCALWRVIRGRAFHWSMLVDVDFIRLFLVPVILHMIWNAPFDLPFQLKTILLGAAGWFVCISLVQEGLREILEEQAAVRAGFQTQASPTP